MTTCELYAKIIAESELLQPTLNEIHKFASNIGPAAAVPAGPAPAPLYLGTYLVKWYTPTNVRHIL